MNKLKKIAFATATIALSSPLFVSASSTGGFDPSGTGAVGVPNGTITGILKNGMNWLLMLVGILGVIGFVIAGILYLTAAGDEGQIDKAKTAMMYSIVGVIVALLGVIVLQAANSFLGGNNTSF